MRDAALLCGVGLVAGCVNALAGGGSFLSVPALVWLGVPPVSANMSSTLALYPGSLASIWASKKSLQGVGPLSLRVAVPVTLAGGICGAVLLLWLPRASFEAALPWLLLLGAILFVLGSALPVPQGRRFRGGAPALVAVQFLLGAYGGYFGGAVGVMMLGAWAAFGATDIRVMNATKVVLVATANTGAAVCFVVLGSIAWSQTLAMLVGATAGGYVGARLGLRVSPARLRLGVGIFCVGLAAIFFYFKVLK
jgi:uncharacterized membrane protein YfcA